MSETDLPWFRCFPGAALASCSDMDGHQFGDYWRVLLFMYQRDGHAPADPKKLRHILNCSVQHARKRVAEWLDEGRMEMTSDGRLTKPRVLKEIKNARKTRQKPDGMSAKTHAENSGKILKNNDPPLLEKETEEEEDSLKSDDHRTARKRTGPPRRYPPDFERFWGAYPDKKNNTKWRALAEWELLEEAEREAALDGLGPYGRHCREAETKFLHAERYLKYRRWESFEGDGGAETLGQDEFRLKSFDRGYWKEDWGARPDDPSSSLHERWKRVTGESGDPPLPFKPKVVGGAG